MISLGGSAMLLSLLVSCSGLFKDPMIDKETGGDVTVLLVDRNFIKTNFDVTLHDLITGQPIENEQVEVRFSGVDAAGLINFSGFKKTSFTTGSGFIEAGYDPNLEVSDKNPIELTVIAISPHYISAPRFISISTVGIKNLDIKMIRRNGGKSAAAGPFEEPYDLIYNGLTNSPLLNYIGDVSSSPTGTAWTYINLYTTTASGILQCANLKDPVLYIDFGAYYYDAAAVAGLMPPLSPTKNAVLRNNDYLYSAILRSNMLKCTQGLTIHTARSDGKPGSGVFDFVITFSDGSTQTGQITCSFPSDHLIEPVYYPGADPAVKVQLTGDNQYDMSGSVSLASPCATLAGFQATPKSNLTAYRFVTVYSCPDSPVGIGLSIVGEFRKTGTTGDWNTFEFKEGVCDLLLEGSADYDFRVNIDGEYHEYSIPTDVNRIGDFLAEHQNEDYQMRSLTIENGNGLITIRADVVFSQGVCDKL